MKFGCRPCACTLSGRPALLYTEGTLTGEDAARYVGTSLENWDAYCRTRGVELPDSAMSPDEHAA